MITAYFSCESAPIHLKDNTVYLNYLEQPGILIGQIEIFVK